MSPRVEEVACPLCGPSGSRLVARKPPHAIVRCDGCGLCYANPRATPAAMSEFYERYFAPTHETEYEHYRSGEEWRGAVARKRVELLSKYATGGRLLDHGCATGVFLEEAARAGWEVYGVEPSDSARAVIAHRAPYAKMLSPGDLAALPQGSFDAVTMFDNFCYLHEPLEALRRFGSLLKPEGVVFSIGALDHIHAHRTEEPGITHTYYYAPETVAKICHGAGFKLLLNTTVVKNANIPGKHPLAWLLQHVPGARNLFFRQHCFIATPEKGA